MPITWSTTILCEDKDLAEFETNIQSWVRAFGSCKKWRDKAKEIIEQKLRHAFRSVAVTISGDEVLDLIDSAAPLKNLACYYTLHLLCNDLSQMNGDQWSAKSEMYYRKFSEEWGAALGLISLDVDESGTIEAGEEYNVKGVKFVRGA